MSNIKRYFFMFEAGKHYDSIEHKEGSYILYADHLKEMESYKSIIKVQADTIDKLSLQVDKLSNKKYRVVNDPEQDLIVNLPPLKKGQKITVHYE